MWEMSGGIGYIPYLRISRIWILGRGIGYDLYDSDLFSFIYLSIYVFITFRFILFYLNTQPPLTP